MPGADTTINFYGDLSEDIIVEDSNDNVKIEGSTTGSIYLGDGDNKLDVYISNLRNKLSKTLIVTIK